MQQDEFSLYCTLLRVRYCPLRENPENHGEPPKVEAVNADLSGFLWGGRCIYP